MEELTKNKRRRLKGRTMPFHLFRYLDEQTFRYNHREGYKDGDRFDAAVRQIVGKRLTLEQLTGKNQPGVFLN